MDKIKKYKSTIIFLLVLFTFVIGIIIIDKLTNKKQIGKYGIKDIKYAANSIIPMYVSEEEIARKYLADYTHLAFTDTKLAYELLDDDYRNNNFSTYKEYSNYIEELINTNKYNISLISYRVMVEDNNKVFYINDNYGNTYIFKEKGVMNYKVSLD